MINKEANKKSSSKPLGSAEGLTWNAGGIRHGSGRNYLPL